MENARKSIRFKLNGRQVSADIGAHQNLVEILQEKFGLFGARESCGQGLCGCCTVLVDCLAVSGCLYLAAFADGAEVVTVEHIASGGALAPEQEAFIECGAFQCGYCTPGILMSVTDFLERNPNPSEAEVEDMLSGHICRCTGYVGIMKAVMEVTAAGGAA